jgi:general secretion pathway protein K
MDPEFFFPSRGSALLLVLWSLVLLSMSVFGVVEIVQASVSHASHLELESQARSLALSGLAVALDPEIEPSDSLLDQQPDGGGKWNVSLQGEAARLNLNYVLATGHREILVRLFTGWGLKQAQAQQAADCLYDWITPGDTPSREGAKIADYRRAGLDHLPTGRLFTSLAEASFVLGMDLVEKANPAWQDSFTLWSDGPLDINEASPELLAALFDLPLSQCQAFVQTRNGKDGIAGTSDDVLVPDVPALKAALGLGDKTLSALALEIGFGDDVRRVRSRGEANGVAVTLSVVTRLKTSPPEYLLWNEL